MIFLSVAVSSAERPRARTTETLEGRVIRIFVDEKVGRLVDDLLFFRRDEQRPKHRPFGGDPPQKFPRELVFLILLGPLQDSLEQGGRALPANGLEVAIQVLQRHLGNESHDLFLGFRVAARVFQDPEQGVLGDRVFRVVFSQLVELVGVRLA